MSIPERFRGRIFFNDIKDAQLRKADKERRRLLEEGVTHEAHLSLSNKGKWPTGSIYLYAAQCVYGPIGSADKKEAAE